MEREQQTHQTKTDEYLAKAERYLSLLDKLIMSEGHGMDPKQQAEVLGTLVGGSLQIAGLRQNIADVVQQNVDMVKRAFMAQQQAQAKKPDILVPRLQPPTGIGG